MVILTPPFMNERIANNVIFPGVSCKRHMLDEAMTRVHMLLAYSPAFAVRHKWEGVQKASDNTTMIFRGSCRGEGKFGSFPQRCILCAVPFSVHIVNDNFRNMTCSPVLVVITGLVHRG